MNKFMHQIILGDGKTLAEYYNDMEPFSSDNPLGRIGGKVEIPHDRRRVSVEEFEQTMREVKAKEEDERHAELICVTVLKRLISGECTPESVEESVAASRSAVPSIARGMQRALDIFKESGWNTKT